MLGAQSNVVAAQLDWWRLLVFFYGGKLSGLIDNSGGNYSNKERSWCRRFSEPLGVGGIGDVGHDVNEEAARQFVARWNHQQTLSPRAPHPSFSFFFFFFFSGAENDYIILETKLSLL